MITVDDSVLGPVDITIDGLVNAIYDHAEPLYDIDTLNRIAGSLIECARLSGMRASVLAGQVLHETNAFAYGGDVVPEQFNFAGIGTTGGGVRGEYFATPEIGMQAVTAHECGYIYGAVTNWPVAVQSWYKLDPRAKYVVVPPHAASVRTIRDYGSGTWAAGDSRGYSGGIVTWGNRVIERSGDIANPIPPQGEPDMQIVDISGELHRNPNGGPNYDNDNKVGIVWHYNGPPPNNDAYTQYKNDAVYHANMDWGGGSRGDGIMYHYGIQSGDGGTYPDGTIFKLRDESAVLWHCAAWVPGGNDTGISINTNIGEGETASDAALASAKWLADDIRSRRNITGVGLCKGHQELSPTACPGSLMGDLVYPYREGSMGGTVQPVEKDDFLHENGHIIGGGFKNIVQNLEKVSHTFRMQFLGYAISEEGDGYLLSPETLWNGELTGKYYVKQIVLQKFERNTLIHEADEPNVEWQDVVPLSNRGFLAGFATDAVIAAVLNDKSKQVA